MSYVRYTERQRAERARQIVALRKKGARLKTIAHLTECGIQTVVRCLRERGLSDYSHRTRGTW